MIHLILAILCSTAITVIFKVTRVDPLALVTVNYGAALAAAVLFMGAPERGLAADPGLLLLGTGLGVLFVAGFLLLAHAVQTAGISLATSAMRLSVAIPFLASWWIWGEVPTPGQALGLVVALPALVLISWPRRRPSLAEAGSPGATLLLVLLFLAGGAVDTSLKAFEEVFADENSPALFLTVVFAVALGVGSAVLGIRRLRTGRTGLTGRVLAWGALLGLVNFGSAEFMLRALRQVPGTVAFPVNNVAVVTLATLLGLWLFREAIPRNRKVGLALAVLALVLFGL